MSPLLAFSDGGLFAVGAVVFIAVFTAAISLAYVRFAELDKDAVRDTARPREEDRPRIGE